MAGNTIKREVEVIGTREGQAAIKNDFQDLFLEAFKKPLPDAEWEHFYLNCPFGQTVSFVCYDGDAMIAHGGLIPQQLVSNDRGKINYFLQTAIMVRERYQTLFWFKDLLDNMASYLEGHGSFAVAYPNNNTYLPFVRMLGWRMVREYSINQYILMDGLPADEKIGEVRGFKYDINKSEQFMRWRGEINCLKRLKTDDFEIDYKEYAGSMELLDVLVLKDGFRIPVPRIMKQLKYNSVNIAGCFSGLVSIKGLSLIGTVGIPQRMCFYPAEHKGCRYEEIRPSLLISDVF
jgi:hypothetical protein